MGRWWSARRRRGQGLGLGVWSRMARSSVTGPVPEPPGTRTPLGSEGGPRAEGFPPTHPAYNACSRLLGTVSQRRNCGPREPEFHRGGGRHRADARLLPRKCMCACVHFLLARLGTAYIEPNRRLKDVMLSNRRYLCSNRFYYVLIFKSIEKEPLPQQRFCSRLTASGECAAG